MRYLVFVALTIASVTALAASKLQLTSPDVQQGKPLNIKQVANVFGCSGGSLSPQLQWQNIPAGTKSFAVTAYDPDAPTGSGWWHWIIYDIPATATGLPAGIGNPGAAALPDGAQEGRNDCGTRDYCGACPPPGDKPHHYVFTLFALKVDKLGVPADATAAGIGFTLNANAIAKATLTPVYSR